MSLRTDPPRPGPTEAEDAATDADDITWFFGYGSLIWRPDFPHVQRRPAVLPGWHRAFCRYSFSHRGTREHPGLVIGLREGGACVGIAYGVAQTDVIATLAYLDDREGAGYLRRALPIRLTDGDETRTAWCYIPNPEHPSYFGEQDPRKLVALVAHGRGKSGTALDYLRDLIDHLRPMGVEEPELASVLAAAERLRAESGAAD